MDAEIVNIAFNLLKDYKLKVGFCESCTGGMVTSKLTMLDGASKVLERSIITYSNRAKIEEVGVKKETLNKYGPVSRQTAIEMAEGLLLKTHIDIAVSITGLAGPSGGSVEKPVGLVYICLATKEGSWVESEIFTGNRNCVQEKASFLVFDLIRKHILTYL